MNDRIISHFLDDISKAIEGIERFISEMDFEQFQRDDKTIRAVERELEIIGEAVKKIPELITKNHPSVPWKAIAGMRDRLIHHYWETEVEILWKTIDESLPPFKVTITEIIEENKKDNK